MRAWTSGFLVGLMACTSVGTDPADPAQPPSEQEATPTPEPTPEPTPIATPTPTAAPVTVQMISATLADECGGSASPPPPPTAAKAKAKLDTSGAVSRSSKARRACQQTSMQLSVVAAADTARVQLAVVKVELFSDEGALLGPLTPRTPTVWSDEGTYQAWDEGISGGEELSVSYTLSEPPWGPSGAQGRRSKTYVLKATLTINGEEQLVQRDVEVAAPTILPPGVKT